jgi:hypothetical protein
VCALLAVAAGKEPAVKIRLYRQVMMANDWNDLTCSVRRDPANRLLQYGIMNYMERSERDLDGEKAPVTHMFHYTHIPCGAGPAYCMVIRADNSEDHVEQSLEIAGCDQ